MFFREEHNNTYQRITDGEEMAKQVKDKARLAFS